MSATLLFPTQNTGTTPLAPEAPGPPNEVLVFRRTEPSKSWLSAHLLYSRMQPYYSIYDWRANFLKHFWRPRWRMQMQSQWNGSYMLLFVKLAFMQPLANILGLCAFKKSKHTLTHQREYMSKGIWVWENLWMCVWRGIYMAYVRLHVREFHKHTDVTGAHEPLSLSVCGLISGSAQSVFWEFRSTNLTGVLREFLLQTTQKRLSPMIKVVE